MKNGFTLIELVIVIILLAILAVTALPKFVGLRSEAISAKMETVAGTINSAKDLVYAAALAKGIERSHTNNALSISYQPKVGDIYIEYGYPTAVLAAIQAATTLKMDRFGRSGEYGFRRKASTSPPSIIIYPNGYTESDQCTVTYFQATITEPARVATNTTGC